MNCKKQDFFITMSWIAVSRMNLFIATFKLQCARFIHCVSPRFHLLIGSRHETWIVPIHSEGWRLFFIEYTENVIRYSKRPKNITPKNIFLFGHLCGGAVAENFFKKTQFFTHNFFFWDSLKNLSDLDLAFTLNYMNFCENRF